MRKIVKVSADRGRSIGTYCYSMWTLWIDAETTEGDTYYHLTHDQLYSLLLPHIKDLWPNINVSCGACSGGGPTDSSTGIRPINKDFCLYFKTPEDEAEFILENQRLVGMEF
jgi:hypothetical protein